MPKKFDFFRRNTLSNLFTIFCGILFFILLYNFSAVKTEILKYLGILAPFLAAFVIAYLLNRPMMFFEQKLFKRLKARRILSILTVYLLAFIIFGALLAVVIPQIGQSIDMLWQKVPEFLRNVEQQMPVIIEKFDLDPQITAQIFGTWEELITTFANQLKSLIPQVINLSVNLGNGIIKSLMAIFASVYMLASKEKLLAQVKKILFALVPIKKADRTMQIAMHSNRVFSDFIIGKLLDSAIIGVMCFVGMLFIYQPYAILISVIIGVTNIIPFFGPFIGAIPCIFILLIANPIAALIFAVFILALQQFDGNYLGPRILGDSTGLSPLWVLVSISVGGGFFGFIGMLIGVPTFAVIYSLVSAFVNTRLTEKGLDVNGNTVKVKANIVAEDIKTNET